MFAPGRVIATRAIHNLRDYGGYAVAGGGRLRDRWLWRSAQHAGATNADLDTVAALGLHAVIDLRGPAERVDAPCPRPAGFDAEIVRVDEETTGLAPHLHAAGVTDAAGAAAAMERTYARMPYRPVLARLYALYFDALARTDGPTLVHCLAGKDRTGLAVALLHALTGVHRDDLMADYLLTNAAGDVEARIAAATPAVRARYGASLGDDALRTLMSVEPRYLHAALAAIEASHGSIDAYAADVLGVTPQRRDALIRRLVV